MLGVVGVGDVGEDEVLRDRFADGRGHCDGVVVVLEVVERDDRSCRWKIEVDLTFSDGKMKKKVEIVGDVED